MIFNIHAGHNPAGKVACGAVGFLNESREARIVKNEVVRILKSLGHIVYDCTVEDGRSAADVLTKIVSKCNSHEVDLDVSIHFNAGARDEKGDGKTTGTECYIYDDKSKAAEKAGRDICEAISALGFKNRGVKVNPRLYFLKRTNAQAVLIECCFVDDKDDAEKYDPEAMARAIVYGLTGQHEKGSDYVTTDTEAEGIEAETERGNSEAIYRVQVGAFRSYEYAKNLQRELELKGISAIVTRS